TLERILQLASDAQFGSRANLEEVPGLLFERTGEFEPNPRRVDDVGGRQRHGAVGSLAAPCSGSVADHASRNPTSVGCRTWRNVPFGCRYSRIRFMRTSAASREL